MMKVFDCLGTNVSITNINNIYNYFFENIEKTQNKYICCANAHTIVYAYENKEYQKIMNEAFAVLPDGGPIAKIGGSNVNKVSGADFFEKILKNPSKLKHFFYGNSKENIEKLINKINKEYVNVEICGYEESKFRDLTEDEKIELRNKIIKSKADIVWVGLGAPKQEIFCSEMCVGTNACWIAVGGAFNVVAGIIPRAPKWMQDHSLEWFYRFIKEPRRLFKRYMIGNTKFVWYNFKYKWKKKN